MAANGIARGSSCGDIQRYQKRSLATLPPLPLLILRDSPCQGLRFLTGCYQSPCSNALHNACSRPPGRVANVQSGWSHDRWLPGGKPQSACCFGSELSLGCNRGSTVDEHGHPIVEIGSCFPSLRTERRCRIEWSKRAKRILALPRQEGASTSLYRRDDAVARWVYKLQSCRFQPGRKAGFCMHGEHMPQPLCGVPSSWGRC